MSEIKKEKLIYDWNHVGPKRNFAKPQRKIEIHDETLRDGLQSSLAHEMSLDDKVSSLHLMNDLKLYSADLGFPRSSSVAEKQTKELIKETIKSGLKIKPNCVARTLKDDVKPIIRISQELGLSLEAFLFVSSSPIRQYIETWSLEKIIKNVKESVAFTVKNNLQASLTIEDATRTPKESLEKICLEGIEAGATRICLCDTVGHGTPDGIWQLVSWVKKLLEKNKLTEIKLGFHGHMDRGLGIWNTVAALHAGAHRVHATALGIGERTGNTPMDTLLVNLNLMGWLQSDLSKLKEYCAHISLATKVPISKQHPVFGQSAFENTSGVHASAVVKAYDKGGSYLADQIYSGVPANLFGLEQKILVGPRSGHSNVIFWLEKNNYKAEDSLVAFILEKAKNSQRNFSDDELHKMIREALS